MSEFLSADWLAAVDTAGRTATSSDCAAAPFTIAHEVTGVPERGEVRYVLRFDAGGIALETADAPADVTLLTDYETAVALARGTANAQQALAGGRLHVRGDITVLTSNAGALSAWADVFAAVRATTDYPSIDFNP